MKKLICVAAALLTTSAFAEPTENWLEQCQQISVVQRVDGLRVTCQPAAGDVCEAMTADGPGTSSGSPYAVGTPPRAGAPQFHSSQALASRAPPGFPPGGAARPESKPGPEDGPGRWSLPPQRGVRADPCAAESSLSSLHHVMGSIVPRCCAGCRPPR